MTAWARLRGPARPTDDSWIVAFCRVRDLPLASFNIEDYADCAEHDGLECPTRTVSVECVVERTAAHERPPETRDANRKPR